MTFITGQILQDIPKECCFCSKKATKFYYIRYGLFYDRLKMGFVCDDHAKKLELHEFDLDRWKINFFEDKEDD